jgi:H2-forming N5,N10-methylenetetrahydromethanopterin dehydrogenase-like enzyme
MTELEIINRKNDNMSLTTAQLDTFLKIAHSLGKFIHFDDEDLREYVIVDPAYLIEVLRSIVQIWALSGLK